VLPLGLQEQQKKRDRSAQIADHRRVTNAMDRCSLCFASTSRARHLTISLGQSAYLALPARSDLVMHSLLDVVACEASAFLCGAKTSVSCYFLCVFQALLSLAIFCVCFKHICLLLSFLCVSSMSVSCYLEGRPTHAAFLHAYCCFCSVCLHL